MACLRDQFKTGVVLGGRYQTISPLNHGSFGMVFIARHLRTGETVAIKCLTKKTAADEAGLDFAVDDKSEELVLHRRLGRHPNIVNLIESFETDSHIYIVLEFCPRGDLYEAIRNGHGPLETEHVRRFMLELIDAVAYIHSKGIYHRDIKPENIFLSETGALKLGDFGLATTEKWTHETTVGSDRYMSPEQYDSAGAGYSPAQADIWAIGICLLNVLFSRNPFTTPTEVDPLFLDFSRDKQSLFDVFPSMSQDTYEVIVQCMNLDPSKRSLVGARNALHRVVSFTTLDEALDDFCSSDRRAIASAPNREPLRTPSIQSPQIESNSAFPWAKALNANTKSARQLSVIPDNESYSEDLFSKSDATNGDWCSAMTGETPSMASVFDSSLGASINSLAISQPMAMPNSKQLQLPYQKTNAKVSPMAGSLPITMSKNRNTPAMSLVFGRKDAVSKSWSDMWDEEEEEEEERARQLEALKRMNARTWSQDSVHDKAKPTVKPAVSVDDDNTPRLGLSPATRTLALDSEVPLIDRLAPKKVDDDFADDILFFSDPLLDEKPEPEPESKQRQELRLFDTIRRDREDGRQQLQVSLRPHPSPLSSASKSPSSSGFDKWEALGERRRAHTGSSTGSASGTDSKSEHDWSPVRPALDFGNSFGYGYNSSYGHGSSDHHYGYAHQTSQINTFNHHYVISNGYSGNSNGHTNNKWNTGKDRIKESSWNKGRGWNWNWRRERRADLTDAEWVGGLQETRS